MSEPFAFDDLRSIMLQCSDAEDLTRDLDENALDVAFPDLGLDSLAVLEIASIIQQHYGLPMSDEVVSGLNSPRDVLDYVSDHLTAR
jgi:minimal PKS acyl carrier protein